MSFEGKTQLWGHKTYFSRGNLAIAADLCENLKLRFTIQHHRAKGKGSFLQQMKRTKFDVFVVETNHFQKSAEANGTIHTFDFEKGSAAMSVALRTSKSDVRQRTF